MLLLLAGDIKATFGIQSIDLLVAFKYLNDRQVAAVVGILFLRIGAAEQRVRAKRHLVAERHFFFSFAIERRSQNADEDQRHAKVNDVASVTASVAVPKPNHRSCQVLAGMAGDHPATAHEL